MATEEPGGFRDVVIGGYVGRLILSVDDKLSIVAGNALKRVSAVFLSVSKSSVMYNVYV